MTDTQAAWRTVLDARDRLAQARRNPFHLFTNQVGNALKDLNAALDAHDKACDAWDEVRPT